MALIKRSVGKGYRINQPVRSANGHGSALPIIADDLEQLHRFAQRDLGLDSQDFTVTRMPYPCYLLPQNQAGRDTERGAVVLAALSIEAEIKTTNLRNELEDYPERGLSCAERFTTDSLQAKKGAD